MAKKKYEESNIQAIAETIRSKTGTEKTYDTSEMADGVNEVYDKGRTDEHNDFWAKYQAKGEVPFGYGKSTYLFANPNWNDETFFPKYDINLSGSCQEVFTNNACTNLKKRLEDCGVRIKSTSSSGITSVNNMFRNVATTELPPIYNTGANSGFSVQRFCDSAKNLIKVPYYEFFEYAVNYNAAFANCSSLIEIEGIDFSSATDTSRVVVGCTSLTTITVYGTIPIGISFADSPLSVESMKSVISCLKDYSTENQGAYTLTLKDTCKTVLEADTDTVEFNGQTYTYFNLITAKGWNLA